MRPVDQSLKWLVVVVVGVLLVSGCGSADDQISEPVTPLADTGDDTERQHRQRHRRRRVEQRQFR